jgi:hypothetical protein
MIEFHELKECEGEPENTLVRWAVQYGSVNGEKSHIANLGIIPVNHASRRGCIWLELLQPSLPFSALRDIRPAFLDFLSLTNWELVCIVDKANASRNHFVKHVGFTPFHETETEICYKGPNYGH